MGLRIVRELLAHSVVASGGGAVQNLKCISHEHALVIADFRTKFQGAIMPMGVANFRRFKGVTVWLLALTCISLAGG